MAALACLLQGCAAAGAAPQVRGVVWQPDGATLRPHGNWQRIGARELIIQWTMVGRRRLMGTTDPVPADEIDAAALAREPWARSVILGLAGEPDEAQARHDVVILGERSEALVKLPTPLTVSGWYFPVELDSTWKHVLDFRSALTRLPRPLWVSVYDSANLGPQALVAQIRRAVPSDVGLLFQDGVGVYARTAAVAREYLTALRQAFGRGRVRVIAEAFRQTPSGFRSATATELSEQIRTYRGFDVYLFDGPHYVDDNLVDELHERLKSQAYDRPNATDGPK